MAGLEGKLDEYLSKSSGIQQEMLESDDFMKTLARFAPEEAEEAQQGPTCRSVVVHAVTRSCAQRSKQRFVLSALGRLRLSTMSPMQVTAQYVFCQR